MSSKKMTRLTERDKKTLKIDVENGMTDAKIREKYNLNASNLRNYRRILNKTNPEGAPPKGRDDLINDDDDEPEENTTIPEPKIIQSTPEVQSNDLYVCGECGGGFNEKFSYCPHCRAQLNWGE